MAVGRGPLSQSAAQLAAAEVVNHQQGHQGEFAVHPALGEQPRGKPEHPNPEYEGQRHKRGDEAVELAFHNGESFSGGGVLAHGMVHKQAREVKNPGKPTDHKDDVKGLNP